MLKKFFIFSAAVMLFMFAASETGFARTSVIESVSYSTQNLEDGTSCLHVELAANRPIEDFSANVNPSDKRQLIFRLKDARLANISRQENLDGVIGRKIFLQENDNNYVQGKLYAQGELTDRSYKIYSVKKDKKNKKNIIAIDIFSTAEASGRDTATVSNVEGRIITLDAGHGGSDSGAVGPSGYTEKEATLAITQNLTDILANSGATVEMTRDTDVDVYGPNASAANELQARVNVGNRAGADIFVSIHCNAFTNSSANGTQTFYYGGSSEGKRLASLIQQEMINANGLYDRGISTCNFYVVKNSYMPAVLIETAFITNPDEEYLLSDPQWQMQLAEAIAHGIEQYFDN